VTDPGEVGGPLAEAAAVAAADTGTAAPYGAVAAGPGTGTASAYGAVAAGRAMAAAAASRRVDTNGASPPRAGGTNGGPPPRAADADGGPPPRAAQEPVRPRPDTASAARVFDDPRLVQWAGRYATYSAPEHSPVCVVETFPSSVEFLHG